MFMWSSVLIISLYFFLPGAYKLQVYISNINILFYYIYCTEVHDEVVTIDKVILAASIHSKTIYAYYAIVCFNALSHKIRRISLVGNISSIRSVVSASY